MRTLALLWIALGLSAAEPSYFGEIRPILQRQCQGCHQPSLKSSNLDLTTYEGLKTGGKRGPGFTVLVQFLTGEIKPQMPFGRSPLPPEQIELVRSWLAAGGKDDTPAGSGKGATEARSARRSYRLYPSARTDRPGVFTRWKIARCFGQPRDPAPYGRWQRAPKTAARSFGQHPFAGLLQGRLSAGGGRRYARPFRRDPVLGSARG